MLEDAIEVPLRLVNQAPSFVTGDRAFVLDQHQVGWVEIGSPLPDDNVWQHFEGDLMQTHVREKGGGGSGGGGGTWDDEHLGYLASIPGSGDDTAASGYIVVERIPVKWERVLIEYGTQRLWQVPIRRTAVIPLEVGNDPALRVFGVHGSGALELLDAIDLAP